MRRNKTAVITGGLVAASLVAGLISTTTLWLRATQAEVRAEADALAAENVSDFLTELFEVSNPDLASADDVSARELLDRGAGRIESELGDEPAVRASLSHTMGRAYSGLGLYEHSIRLLRSAVQTRENILGLDDRDARKHVQPEPQSQGSGNIRRSRLRRFQGGRALATTG